MKKMLTTLFFGLSFLAQAQTLDQDFTDLLSKRGFTTKTDHVYCLKESGKVAGIRLDQAQEIASVSKLYTTLFAFQVLDVKKTYQTHFYFTKDQLHIAGSMDPYFESEKLLYLIDALNTLGFTKFEKITFDQNFVAHDSSRLNSEMITTANVTSALKRYFNTAKWGANEKYRLNVAKNFAEEEGMTNLLANKLIMAVNSIEFSNENPLRGQNVYHYVHTSKPLYQMLKTLNVLSKNTVAQAVYEEASKIKDFKMSMAEAGISLDKLEFYNGSGLPTLDGNGRKDNKATCRNILSMLEVLRGKIEAKKLLLEEIIQVGTDHGTLEDRLEEHEDLRNSLIAKTGTLAMASTLAGFLSSDVKIPFAILNKTYSVVTAKKFQDDFIAKMFEYHSAQPLIYEPQSIFPVPNKAFLSSI